MRGSWVGAAVTTCAFRTGAPFGSRKETPTWANAPVELPCAAGETGPLCNRDAAVFDVARRFGMDSGRTVAGLQLLCGGSAYVIDFAAQLLFPFGAGVRLCLSLRAQGV